MASTVDERCRVAVVVDARQEEELDDLLNPDKLPYRCRCFVKKHPDCCRLCRINNDCRLIPMHFQCRCVRVYECF